MSKVVLVSGLLPYESGKTYFTASLARALKTLGYEVTVYKPVAAHSIWYQIKSFRDSLKLGILVGEDVLKYISIGLIKDPDLQNPIDILTAVPDIARFTSVDMYLSTIESALAQAVLVRISSTTRKYFLIEDVLRNLTSNVRNEIMKALDIFSPVSRVSSSWLNTYLSSGEADAIIRQSINVLLSMSEVVLVESFSNALLPAMSLMPYINVAVIVTPGRAMMYSGNKLSSYVSAIRSVNELESKFFARLIRPDALIEVSLSEGWPPPPLEPEVVEQVIRFLSI